MFLLDIQQHLNKCVLKWIVQDKIAILLSFIHPHDYPNLHVTQKEDILRKVYMVCMEVIGICCCLVALLLCFSKERKSNFISWVNCPFICTVCGSHFMKAIRHSRGWYIVNRGVFMYIVLHYELKSNYSINKSSGPLCCTAIHQKKTKDHNAIDMKN